MSNELEASAQGPTVTDPLNIPETVCDGPFNVVFGTDRALITFTHTQAQAAPLFASGTVNLELLVRARIAMSLQNIYALRDLLNRLFPQNQAPTENVGSGGATKLH
jgi:hypothetical protein